MLPGIPLLARFLLAVSALGWPGDSPPGAYRGGTSGCPGSRPRGWLGFLGRPLTLVEMVSELERGCLELEEVRFRPGQDTIESVPPARLADLARALGMARGAYRISVPPERSPGWPPDTVQARRRAMRLREDLLHYGASGERLLEDAGWPNSPRVAAPGGARPSLVRVPGQ